MNEGFGSRSMHRLDRSFETRPAMIEAHAKALSAFEADSIDLEEFRDLYGSEVIDADLAKVARLKSNFAPEDRNKFASEIMEGIIYDQSERSDWLGPYAQTIRASEYDDYVNGIDLVVEFDEPERSRSHLALGVDATFSRTNIEKKLRRVKDEIDSGSLASIKYFRSQNGRFMGRLTNVPRVVTGMEKDRLLELATIWNQDDNKTLAAHPAQRLLLAQIAQQLKVFKGYAERTGKHQFVRPFDETLATIRGVSEKKTSIDVSSVRDDTVHKEIVSCLEMFK
ncbi:MAG TPA: hypothetical protein VGE48_00360 [Candidatus Paceibacterota bacterium]